MQFTIITFLAAFLPALTMGGPVAAEAAAVAPTPLAALGIDICDKPRVAGNMCNYGPSGNQPHACGKNDDRAILKCVRGKWALDRKRGVGQRCGCTDSNDLVCKG